MRPNSELKVHFVNVNHGDAIILEFPDYGNPPGARFGVVDFGAKRASDRPLLTRYLRSLIDLRRDNDSNFQYVIEFACCTHPHNDHYGGLRTFMNEFTDAQNAGR